LSQENIERMRQASRSEPAWQLLGIKLEEISDGYAKVSFKTKPEFLNFVGTVHGGIIATLADSVFGYALNSLHFPTVASQFNIHFLNPTVAGDELVAECRVIKAGKRIAMAEIEVKTRSGKLIAKATGTGIPLDREPG
jgi:acyl-CoA thioesterase